MQSYYDLLQVEISCSPEDLRRAFRRRAKELHPDLTSAAESVEKMRLLIQAYRTLSDPILREDYDRRHAVHAGKVRFDYREFLRQRGNDLASQAKLVFFDLLHNSSEDALALYNRVSLAHGFWLQDYLDREDFMDCAFLLAEEFERRDQLESAYDLLVRIAQLERERPYFRHFFEEVTARLRSIVCFRMPVTRQSKEVLSRLDELISLRFTRKDTAFFLKKAAELHLENDNTADAAECLRRGLELDQKLSGHKKLQQKISGWA